MRRMSITVMITMGMVVSTAGYATPVVPGYVVEHYADVTDPCMLTFDPSGNLYTGRDNGGSGGSYSEAVIIHRIGPGGTPVEEYGNEPIPDPDAVLYDAQGIVSGTAGSVLVGGRTADSRGHITAVYPDGNVSTVVGPSTVMIQPQDMEFDSTGRVIIADTHRVTVVVNGIPSTLFTTPAGPMDVEVNELDQIFVATDDGVIRLYDSDGTLVNDQYATGLLLHIPHYAFTMALGPGGPLWGKDLYVLSGGELLRFDSFGNSTVLGSGFTGGGIEFGPDGALYVGQFYEDSIIRIIPEPATLSLLVFSLLMLLKRRSA